MMDVSHKLKQSTNALRCAALTLSVAVEEEMITGDHVFNLLQTIADQLQETADNMDRGIQVNGCSKCDHVR